MRRTISTRHRQDFYLPDRARTIRCPLGSNYVPSKPSLEERLADEEEKRQALHMRLDRELGIR